MFTIFQKRFLFNLTVIGFVSTGVIFGQNVPEQPKQVNFRYSQNPKTKSKPESQNTQTNTVSNSTASINEVNTVSKTEEKPAFESRSVAKKTMEIAKRANAAASPTEIYKVGIGDVLFISLLNVPTRASTYYTVLNDGTIDYPLAGEMVAVQGLTTEDIEDLLKEKIKLYENSQVSVKVREHASHKIVVLGLVANAGDKFLQREAIPLYVVRAEATVQSDADTVIIKRSNAETENISLKDPKSEDILIFPGDIVEFKSAAPKNTQAPQFYYIGGNIVSAGQKDYYPGLTLTQAILASGGLKKINIKNVTIRRKNDVGLLSPFGFDLKAIKDGRQPDPVLQAGDTIELGVN